MLAARLHGETMFCFQMHSEVSGHDERLFRLMLSWKKEKERPKGMVKLHDVDHVKGDRRVRQKSDTMLALRLGCKTYLLGPDD